MTGPFGNEPHTEGATSAGTRDGTAPAPTEPLRADGAGPAVAETQAGDDRVRDPVEGLYGRRRGQPLSARRRDLLETLYPRLAIDPDGPPPARAADLFGHAPRAVWLEIGFGGGEHLLHQARRHPDVGLVGCEPFENGMAKALSGIAEEGLSNVRLFLGDARRVVDWLPDAGLERVFLLYPDPWPKKRHRKRRFVSQPALDRLARAMAPGAELRFATDIADYAAWTEDHVARHPAFARADPDADPTVPWDDWIPTRYEEKAVRAGRTPRYFGYRRL